MFMILLLSSIANASSVENCAKLLYAEPIFKAEYKNKGYTYTMINEDAGYTTGTLKYTVFDENRSIIEVNWVSVSPDKRNKGIQGGLFTRMIALNKEATSIAAMLVFTNYDAFIKTYSLTKNCIQAVMSTPFYRSLSKLGFKRIKACEPGDELVMVMVNR